MKMNFTKSILTFASAVLVASTGFSQFKGSIEFTKKVGTMDVNYKYYVSGDDIRIEEVNDGQIDGVQIMDLEAGKIYALSPERKMYMEVPNKRPSTELDVDVKKTGKSKEINGKKCAEIVVTCKAKDRKIVYWVTKGNYDFFIPMLETLNRKENQSMFFLEMDGMKGYFPMQSTEYVLSSGKVVSELATKSISPKSIETGKFKIPDGYKMFEK